MSEVDYNTPIPGGSDELTDDQMNALADAPINLDNPELTDEQMTDLADEPINLDNSELTDDQMNELADTIIPGAEESTEEPALQEDNGEGISY